jgi:hypothetical protein
MRASFLFFSVVSCATQCEFCTESNWGFAKLIKGRHATKVAIINLSGLFEITITVKYLNFLRFEICANVHFLLLFKEYKKLIFQFSDVFTDLLFFFNIRIVKTVSINKKNKHPKEINFSIVLLRHDVQDRF